MTDDPTPPRAPGVMKMITSVPDIPRSAPPSSAPEAPPQSLGAGRLIGAAFRIFLAHPVAFGLAAGLPAAISQIVVRLAGPTGGGTVTGAAGIFAALATIIPITLMANEAAAGRPVRLRAALNWGGGVIGPALWAVGAQLLMLCVTAAPAIILLAVAGTRAALIAAPVLVLVAWGAATLTTAMPAVLLGGARYGAPGRSFRLTKGYRRPIVGANLGVIALVGLAGMGLGMVGVVLGIVLGRVVGLEIVPAISIIEDLLAAVLAAPIYILPVLIYRRLIDIKEGGEAKALAEVFS